MLVSTFILIFKVVLKGHLPSWHLTFKRSRQWTTLWHFIRYIDATCEEREIGPDLNSHVGTGASPDFLLCLLSSHSAPLTVDTTNDKGSLQIPPPSCCITKSYSEKMRVKCIRWDHYWVYLAPGFRWSKNTIIGTRLFVYQKCFGTTTH